MKINKFLACLLSLSFGLIAQIDSIEVGDVDLAASTGWVNVKHQDGWIDCGTTHINEMFGKYASNNDNLVGIREMHYYTNNETDKNVKPLLVVLLHGTFSQHSTDYYMPGTITFEATKKYAEHLASNQKAATCLISYQWSGLNQHDARIADGKTLAKILDAHFRDFRIVTIAHSHGGNVVNVASNHLKHATLDTIIHLATPVLENTNKLYKAKNFDTLINFYTTGDIVQFLGSIDPNDVFSRKGSCRKVKNKKYGRVINIRTQIDGSDTNHCAIKSILKDMHTIGTKLSFFKIHADFDLNIDLQGATPAKVLLAIRTLTPEVDPASLEVLYSNYQQKVFEQAYGKQIGYKGNIITGTYSKAHNTIAMIKPIQKIRKLFKI